MDLIQTVEGLNRKKLTSMEENRILLAQEVNERMMGIMTWVSVMH